MVVPSGRSLGHARRLRADEGCVVPRRARADHLHALSHLAHEGGSGLGPPRAGRRLQRHARRLPGPDALLGHRARDGPDDVARPVLEGLDRPGRGIPLDADGRVGRPLPGLSHPRQAGHRLREAVGGASRRRQWLLHAARRHARRLLDRNETPLEVPARARRGGPAVGFPRRRVRAGLFGPAVSVGLRAQLRYRVLEPDSSRRLSFRRTSATSPSTSVSNARRRSSDRLSCRSGSRPSSSSGARRASASARSTSRSSLLFRAFSSTAARTFLMGPTAAWTSTRPCRCPGRAFRGCR